MNETDRNFVVLIRLDGVDVFAIWISSPSDRDRLVTTDGERLSVFANRGGLDSYAEDHDILIELDDVPHYDFDAVMDWTIGLRLTDIDCVRFLNVWSLLIDIERSLGSELKEPYGSRTVYQKLFCGNNISAVTP